MLVKRKYFGRLFISYNILTKVETGRWFTDVLSEKLKFWVLRKLFSIYRVCTFLYFMIKKK